MDKKRAGTPRFRVCGHFFNRGIFAYSEGFNLRARQSRSTKKYPGVLESGRPLAAGELSALIGIEDGTPLAQRALT